MIDLLFITHRDGERSIVDGKMLANCPFEGMMKAFCEKENVLMESVSFHLIDGREIQPNETAERFGWTESMGTLFVQAFIHHGTSRTEGKKLVGVPSGDGEEKTIVEVTSKGPDGDLMNQFRMRPTTSFDKMMKAWCEAHDMDQGRVWFHLKDGRELRADENLVSIGWQRTSGTLHVHVVHKLPGQDPEKIRVDVISETGTVSNFKVPAGTMLERMMRVWCESQDQRCERISFTTDDGTEVLPQATPRGLGWSNSVQGPMVLRARTREKPPADPSEKIKIEVISHDDSALVVNEFRVKPTCAFEKMMKAWCDHQGVSMDRLRFLQIQRELRPDETPKSLGWTATDRAYVIQAACRDAPTSAAAPEVPYFSPPPGLGLPMQKPDEASTAPPAAVPAAPPGLGVFLPPQRSTTRMGPALSAMSAMTGTKSSLGSPKFVQATSIAIPSPRGERKVKVEVVVMGPDGEYTFDTELSLPQGARFEEVLRPWCERKGFAVSQVTFQLDGRELRLDESPASRGWSVARGSLVVKAVPPGRAKAKPTGTADDEKITVKVIPEDLDADIVQVRMKVTTPFEKLMRSWCQNASLPFHDVVFEHDGHTLEPQESPESVGWTTACGEMTVKAYHGRFELVQVPTLAVDASYSEAMGSAHSLFAPSRSVRRVESADGGDGDKINVLVVSAAAQGADISELRMRMTTPFQKVMSIWCDPRGLDVSDVRFELDGRELRPSETPESRKWTASRGVLLINANPKKDENRPSSTTSASTLSSSSVHTMSSSRTASTGTIRASSYRSNESMSIRPAGSDDAKVDVEVVSEEPRIESIVQVRMKMTTSFEKMMKAWCDDNALSMFDVAFEHNGRKILPIETLTTYGWSPVRGTFHVKAKCVDSDSEKYVRALSSIPKRSTAETHDPQEEAPVAAGRVVRRASSSNETEKVDVEVTMAEDAGDSIVSLRMRPTLPFHKMMRSWCEHHEVELGDVRFEFQGRELLQDETPESLGWNASRGTLSMKASTVGKDVKETAVRSSSAASSKATVTPMPSVEMVDDKIPVQVISEDEETELRMKLSTPFEKVMRTWCDHRGISLGDMRFMHDGRDLHPQDTPISIGWTLGKGELRLTTARKAAAKTLSEKGSDEKIDLRLEVADSLPGETITNLRMKLGTLFQKVFAAWVQQTGVEHGTVQFFYDSPTGPCRLQPYQTPSSLGWSAQMGTLVVRVVPSDEPDSSDLQPVKVLMSNPPSKKVTIDIESLIGRSVSSRPPEEVEKKEKVTVDVLVEGIDGTRVDTCHLRPGDSFQKLMDAWSRRHEIPQEEVRFIYNGFEIMPNSTPMSIGWRPSREGTLEVKAVPSGVASSDSMRHFCFVASEGPADRQRNS